MNGFFTPEGVYRRTVVFTAGDTDPRGRVRPDAILYQFQEIAGDHFTSLQLGSAPAAARGVFWAVTRNELLLLTPPVPGDELLLDTWVARQGHGIFWRHYRLLDREETVLARGVSMWVLMDVTTRTLARDYAWAQLSPTVTVEGALNSSSRGVVFPEALPMTARRTVTEAETDVNGHLNNTLYIPWGTDLLPPEFLDSHSLRRLWIEYRKELPKGHEAVLHYAFADDILYLKGFEAEKECFSLKVEYDSICQ